MNMESYTLTPRDPSLFDREFSGLGQFTHKLTPSALDFVTLASLFTGATPCSSGLSDLGSSRTLSLTLVPWA